MKVRVLVLLVCVAPPAGFAQEGRVLQLSIVLGKPTGTVRRMIQ